MSWLSLIFRLEGDNSHFKSKLRDSVDSTESAFSKMAGAARRFLTVAVVTAAAKGAADYGSLIHDISQRLEVGTDSAQQFFAAAKRGSSDIGAIARGMESTGDAMAKVLEGGKAADKMEEAFSRLGVTLDDIQSGDREAVFRKIFAVMADGNLTIQQQSAGFDILGKRMFGQLVPVAREMAAAMKEIKLDPSQLKALDAFGDAFTSLGIKIKVAVGNIITSLDSAFGGDGIPFLRDLMFGIEPGAEGRVAAMEQKFQESLKRAKAKNQMTTDAEEGKKKTLVDLQEKINQLIFDSLTMEEQLAQVQERKAAALEKIASLRSDTPEWMEANLERLKMEAMEKKLQESLAPKEQQAGGVSQIGSSDTYGLRRIGGIIGPGVAGDPLVTVAQLQLRELRTIAGHTAKLGDNPFV